MRSKTWTGLVLTGALALGSQAYGQTTATYDSVAIGNFGVLDWQPISGTFYENIGLGNILGPVNLYSLTVESSLFQGDGGVNLTGTPVRVLLGGTDYVHGGTSVGTGVFEIWNQGLAHAGTTSSPAFKVDTTAGTSAFKGVDLTVGKTGATGGNLTVEGSLTVSGKPVLTAIGTSTAAGTGAFVVGSSNSAPGANSFAGGSGSVSLGTNAFAWGGSANASSTNSIALGTNSISPGTDSVSIGRDSQSWGLSSVALAGGQTYGATPMYSVAAAGGVTGSSYSFAAGSGVFATSFSSAALGVNSASFTGTSLTTWAATDPVFVVGNGETTTARSNAQETLKNGQTTLRNKYWVPGSPTAPVTTAGANGGNALVVEGNALLKGRVVLATPQGDINMGIYAPAP